MAPAAQVVDVGQLLHVVATALVAGVGISIAFSLVILGTVRAGERRQQDRTLAAGVHALLATVAALACLGAIVFGITTMLSK
jgi:uncharacterized membrane protein